jgi:hypothetical protein
MSVETPRLERRYPLVVAGFLIDLMKPQGTLSLLWALEQECRFSEQATCGNRASPGSPPRAGRRAHTFAGGTLASSSRIRLSARSTCAGTASRSRRTPASTSASPIA